MSDGIYLLIGIMIQPFIAVLAMHYGHRWLASHEHKTAVEAEINQLRMNLETARRSVLVIQEENKALRRQLEQSQQTLVVN